jgi:3'-phosphoadenosine 5'-phosphosulfate sulfotransferase (PAPS reductase)/FAD synthetase
MRQYELQQMQGLPLRMKIRKTEKRIREWYEAHDGDVYVSFSGGVGSTVLARIARDLYPKIPLVFCNTGQECDAILNFVPTWDNVTVIRPKHSYKWVIDNYGYPIISKETSKNISRYRNTKSEVQRHLRLWGGINPTSGKAQHSGVIPKKYHHLVNAPFKISDVCCNILKKDPFARFDRETGLVPMTGEMAIDSNRRTMQYLAHGCNYFGKHHKSTPMGFWTQQDVFQYLLDFKVPYCSAYGSIEYDPVKQILFTTGERHTGCVGCMFGIDNESVNNNRFTRLKQSDPIRWDICINKYGQGKVLDYLGVKYE